jgi:hypothetical protein
MSGGSAGPIVASGLAMPLGVLPMGSSLGLKDIVSNGNVRDKIGK